MFSGALSPFLSQGIGLGLIGSTVMAGIALWSFNCRAAIVQPQDVTKVMVAAAAGALVAGTGLTGETAFAIVLVMVGLSTLFAGQASTGPCLQSERHATDTFLCVGARTV